MAPGATAAIAVDSVSKHYGTTRAVDGATLSVQPGELFAVLGPSGSGKSTLLRLIAGFERPDAGSVAVAGREVAGPRAWVEPERRRLGMVFQDDALFPHLDVARNVGFGVRGDAERVRAALELVGLADRADSHPGELSGGERQRVALARALAPRPEVVLLDEPFSSLDAALKGRLRREVAAILRRSGATGILVTHDQEEALSLADRIAIIRDGHILQVGRPEDVYWTPTCEWTAAFLGDVNVFDGHDRGDDVATALGRFVRAGGGPGGRVRVGVRPEQLAIVPDDAGAGVIEERDFRGHDVMYEVRHAALGRVLVQLPSVELFDRGIRVSLQPQPGARAAVLAPVA